jgi:tetratricopeptide (TPR) repeat protein
LAIVLYFYPYDSTDGGEPKLNVNETDTDMAEDLIQAADRAEMYMSNGSPSLAINECEDAINKLSKFIPNRIKSEYARLQYIRGSAYYALSRCNDKDNNLKRSIEAFIDASRNMNKNSPYCAEINNSIAIAYIDLSEVIDAEDNLLKAILFLRYYHNSIKEKELINQAKYLTNNGTASRYLAEIKNAEVNIKISIKEYEDALRLYTKLGENELNENISYNIGIVRNNLGTAYRILSKVENKSDNLDRSISNNSIAIDLLKNHSSEYALAEYNRGIVFNSLSEVEDREYNVNQSIYILNNSLKHQEICSIQKARTLRDLGLAYVESSEISSGQKKTEDLQYAFVLLNESRDIFEKENCTNEYSKSLNALGIAFYHYAQLNNYELYMKESLSCFRISGLFFVKDKYPIYYAGIKRNEGLSYRAMAASKIDPKTNLENSILSYKEAINYWRQNECAFDAAATEILLGYAYRELARLDAENCLSNRQKAIESFENSRDILKNKKYDIRKYNINQSINETEALC